MRNWSPEGFDRYRELFPVTPLISVDDDLDKSEVFRSKWTIGVEAATSNIEKLTSDTSIVFIRGYLGNYMPGNLIQPVRTLKQLGFDSFILQNKSGDNVSNNVAMLADQLAKRETKKRLLFCGHSKGGMECLWLLAKHETVASRCIGVALSQTPSGASMVMESILHKRHRECRYSSYRHVSETAQGMMLSLLNARPGGYDLTSDIWPRLVDGVANREWSFPVLQTASWSIQPTAWLDSFHTRLGEIFPGRAHDGQFYLDDLIWPRFAHVLLPEIDHAQPAMGGSGFDCSRYWLTLLSVLTDMIEHQSRDSL